MAAVMSHRARCLIVLWLLLGIALSSAKAKSSEWKTARGETFRGEPVEQLGPFVVFRTAGGGGRRVPMGSFSAEDCQRIHAVISRRPPRGATLARATGAATAELKGNMQRVQDQALVPDDLSGRPEPQMLLLLCGSHNDADGWFMASNLLPFYRRVQRVYPGVLEAVFLGVRHEADQQRNIAVSSGMPWLIADYFRQRTLSFAHYLPRAEGANLVLLSREGVPLAHGRGGDAKSVQEFFDQVSTLLTLLDPDNPATWRDRLHYLRAVRLVEFAQGRSAPVLVGNPLRVDGLRRHGVKRVAARLEVSAEGKVAPALLSGPEDVPSGLADAVVASLEHAVVLPAIEQGRPVAGTLDFDLPIPPSDPTLEAERAWLGSTFFPTLAIPEWLVLRPVPVPEKEFQSAVVGETAAGTVVMSALEVSAGRVSRTAQLSAFSSDWFAEQGAASVQPRAGDRQVVDTVTLTWEKVRSVDGFVDMQTGIGKDYVVGYAWAEFESPREADALLGLGSDDGVKIWLNGSLVLDKWIRRPSRVDEDIVPVRLRKGANRILVKIQNITREWSFIYRLRLLPQ